MITYFARKQPKIELTQSIRAIILKEIKVMQYYKKKKEQMIESSIPFKISTTNKEKYKKSQTG